MKNHTLRITVKIQNDLSELGEDTFHMSWDEMINTFGSVPELNNLINRAQNYANAENLNEEEFVDPIEYVKTHSGEEYDGSSKIDLINSDETFN